MRRSIVWRSRLCFWPDWRKNKNRRLRRKGNIIIRYLSRILKVLRVRCQSRLILLGRRWVTYGDGGMDNFKVFTLFLIYISIFLTKFLFQIISYPYPWFSTLANPSPISHHSVQSCMSVASTQPFTMLVSGTLSASARGF